MNDLFATLGIESWKAVIGELLLPPGFLLAELDLLGVDRRCGGRRRWRRHDGRFRGDGLGRHFVRVDCEGFLKCIACSGVVAAVKRRQSVSNELLCLLNSRRDTSRGTGNRLCATHAWRKQAHRDGESSE